jgi:hypothetical protein
MSGEKGKGELFARLKGIGGGDGGKAATQENGGMKGRGGVGRNTKGDKSRHPTIATTTTTDGTISSKAVGGGIGEGIFLLTNLFSGGSFPSRHRLILLSFMGPCLLPLLPFLFQHPQKEELQLPTAASAFGRGWEQGNSPAAAVSTTTPVSAIPAIATTRSIFGCPHYLFSRSTVCACWVRLWQPR